jgi:hypothetical protein
VRVRALIGVAAVLLACTGLTACETNAGQAATIDSHRVSHTDVNRYFTEAAKPVQEQSSSGQAREVPPRSYVLEVLINERLYQKFLDLLGSDLTSDDIDQQVQTALQGTTLKAAAESAGLKGYTTQFHAVWARTRIMQNDITTAANAGADVQGALKKLKFPVSVNPRYGSWDGERYALAVDNTAGVPDFVTLVSGPSTSGANPLQ